METCTQCKDTFEITDVEKMLLIRLAPKCEDQTFPLPLPRRCPHCREQIRMAWRNERNLFKRKDSYTGAPLVSFFPPETPFPVIDHNTWWKDGWDACSFGREIDFTRSLFDQIHELRLKVPRPHVYNYPGDRLENSQYTNCAGDVKNCYLIFAAGQNENCMYSNYINGCQDCVDCFFVLHSTNCYECIDLETCHSVAWCDNSKECFDSFYLYDCRAVKNSICCTGLRQKEYHILNKPVSAEKYKETKQAFLTNDPSVKNLLSEFEALKRSTPRKSYHGDRNEESTGDFIWNTKNCIQCFDTSKAWDCAYCTWFVDGKDCMDIFSWGEMELCYQISGGGQSHYNCTFTAKSFGCRACHYVDLCMYSKNCFACVGLKQKEYCILNREYTKDEYFKLLPKVYELMKKFNEWGEYFPLKHAPWGYNYTVANDLYPLNKEDALKLGATWDDYVSPSVSGSSEKIKTCAVTGKNFRLTDQELIFYKRNGLPIPTAHYEERYFSRLRRRNPRHLYARFCESCGIATQSTYSPMRPELVYCERCYVDKIYN